MIFHTLLSFLAFAVCFFQRSFSFFFVLLHIFYTFSFSFYIFFCPLLPSDNFLASFLLLPCSFRTLQPIILAFCLLSSFFYFCFFIAILIVSFISLCSVFISSPHLSTFPRLSLNCSLSSLLYISLQNCYCPSCFSLSFSLPLICYLHRLMIRIYLLPYSHLFTYSFVFSSFNM